MIASISHYVGGSMNSLNMEYLKIIRDLGATFIKKLDLSDSKRTLENKNLIKTIDDGFEILHRTVKAIPKPEKEDPLDIKPLIDSDKTTRESIKLVKDELTAIKATIKDTSKDIVEASKMTSKAISNIKIDNPIIKPEKPEKIDFSGILAPIKTLLTSIKTVFENKGTKKEPIYVISVNELGNINEGGGETRSYGGFSRDIMGLNNAEGKAINPSTEEKQDALITAIENIEIPPTPGVATEAKQDAIITAIENIEIPIPAGASTEAKQDVQIVNDGTMISLIGTLNELNARLQVLAGMANSGAPALRIIPIASVSTPVTGTVTATANISTQGGIPSYVVTQNAMNQLPILSNINNVVIT